MDFDYKSELPSAIIDARKYRRRPRKDRLVNLQRARFFAALFIVTASTLILQIVQTRLLSVVTWYHLAFLVIGLAMFGLTAGAVWVYTRRDRFAESTVHSDTAFYTAAYGISLAVCIAIQMTVPPLDGRDMLGAIGWLQVMGCIAVPFFFAGVVVSLALTRSPYPIAQTYAVDLAGAAAGSLLVLGMLNLFDAVSAILWLAPFLVVASLLFDGAGRHAAVPRATRSFPARRWILFGLAAFALANSLASDRLRPMFVKGKIELGPSRPVFIGWNTYSRVSVHPEQYETARLWGASPKYDRERWKIHQRWTLIDGLAGTIAYRIQGRFEGLGFLDYDVTNLAYHLPNRRVGAVIGIGGGRDLVAARYFGLRSVTGIEINPILVDLIMNRPGFAEYVGLPQFDGIRIVVDEARSWLTRTSERFDVIQMSLIDTWASTGAGAFSLSENGLYTVDAWRIFLRDLSDDGVLTVSRYHAVGQPDETARLVSLAMAAAQQAGFAKPRDHIYLASAGNVATLILSRAPLSMANLVALDKVAADKDFAVLLRPGRRSASPTLEAILSSRSESDLRALSTNVALDITPPTDNRPFFFNQLRFDRATTVLAYAFAGNQEAGVLSGNLRATKTLFGLFILSCLLVYVTIVLPLRPALADCGRATVLWGTTYFLLIGLGFILVEIGLLQRMSIFLGHPVYALSIVLFCIILSTGLGSAMSSRIPLATPAALAVWSLVTAGMIAVLPSAVSIMVDRYEAADIVVRAAVCVAVIFPCGIMLGFGFPTGMRLVGAINKQPQPWFWGTNGAAGVLGSSAAVAISIAYGTNWTVMVGALCYALILPAALILHRTGAVTARASRTPR